MGGELKAKAGETVTVTIRFKSPDRNNYQYPINGGVNVNMRPVVDHIDLIAGDVTPRAAAGHAGLQQGNQRLHQGDRHVHVDRLEAGQGRL
jgi:hypothetical protein